MKNIVKVLEKKDGSSVGLGVLLAFVAQGSVLGVADYLRSLLVKGSAYNPNANLLDGFLVPVLTLVIAVALVEAGLWAYTYTRTLMK